MHQARIRQLNDRPQGDGSYVLFACLPNWARRTLAEHVDDRRPQRYTRAQMEAGQTGDRYWCDTPEDFYRTAFHLNNKYFLDGRDPNSYANVGWLFGLHDRPWQEREVFGKYGP